MAGQVWPRCLVREISSKCSKSPCSSPEPKAPKTNTHSHVTGIQPLPGSCGEKEGGKSWKFERINIVVYVCALNGEYRWEMQEEIKVAKSWAP